MNSADGQHSPSSTRRIVRGSYPVSMASCFWAIFRCVRIPLCIKRYISKKEAADIQPAVSEVTQNERLSLYVPTEIMKQIKLIAGATGTSKNKLVIDLIGQALQNTKYQKICAAMLEVNKNIND